MFDADMEQKGASCISKKINYRQGMGTDRGQYRQSAP
jgi:hypothetical protein